MAVTFFEDLSVRERILQNIKETLEQINQSNRFAVNIAPVLRNRVAGYDLLDFPTLMLVGTREQKQRVTASPDKNDTRLFVDIEVLATNEAVHDSEEYHNLILRDVEAALMEDETRGGLARHTDITGTQFTVVAAQSPYALSILSLEIKFQHSSEDPTQAR